MNTSERQQKTCKQARTWGIPGCASHCGGGLVSWAGNCRRPRPTRTTFACIPASPTPMKCVPVRSPSMSLHHCTPAEALHTAECTGITTPTSHPAGSRPFPQVMIKMAKGSEKELATPTSARVRNSSPFTPHPPPRNPQLVASCMQAWSRLHTRQQCCGCQTAARQPPMPHSAGPPQSKAVAAHAVGAKTQPHQGPLTLYTCFSTCQPVMPACLPAVDCR